MEINAKTNILPNVKTFWEKQNLNDSLMASNVYLQNACLLPTCA